MTYQELYNIALSAVLNVCNNFSDNNTIPSEFTGSYSTTQTTNRARLTIALTTPVPSVSRDTAQNEFSQWMTSHITNLGAEVEPRGLFNFYCALASFCAAKIRVVAGQVTTQMRMMYYSAGNPESYPAISGMDNIVYATDIQTCTSNINLIISSNTRSFAVAYSYVVSNT